MSKTPLYRQVLGNAFDTLPPQVQKLHDSSEPRQWSGRADVTRGQGLISALVCAIFGFPKSQVDIPVTVSFEMEGDTEVWHRDFDGQKFKSVQFAGEGQNSGRLGERFGPFTVMMDVPVIGKRLQLVPRGWSIFGMKLPAALLPSDQSFEYEEDGKFRFKVEIAVPVLGSIVAYQGWLEERQG